jgi:hypothetical protein
MQSSAMMAVRAMTLLICLAAVPLLAIFGKSLPAVVKSFLHSYTNSARPPHTSADRTDPPVFRPGLLASKPEHDLQTGTPAVDGAKSKNVGVLPAQPLVPIDTAVHRPDSSTAALISRNAQTSTVSSAGQTPSKAGFPPGYFQEAELRLRQLGATYYLLETLDADAGQYRFFCKVALGPNQDDTLAFFATDRDPLAAMQQVVRQIEGWRTHAHPN